MLLFKFDSITFAYASFSSLKTQSYSPYIKLIANGKFSLQSLSLFDNGIFAYIPGSNSTIIAVSVETILWHIEVIKFTTFSLYSSDSVLP